MNTITEEWAHWIERKRHFGWKAFISGILLALWSLCILGLMLYLNRPAARYILPNKYQYLLFYGFSLCLLSGLGIFLMGVFIKSKATLPTDIYKVPPASPTSGARAALREQGQIIKSEVFFSFRSVIGATLVLVLGLGLCIFSARSGLLPGSWAGSYIFLTIILILAFALIMYLALAITSLVNDQYHTVVTIDNSDKVISFRNLNTKEVRAYSFNELDGFVNARYVIRGKSSSTNRYVIYLVKQEARIEKISSGVYKNFSELNAALGPLKQLKFTETLPVKL